MQDAVPDFVTQELDRLGIALDAGVLARLAAYLDLLLEANQRFNLTAVRDRDAAWRRHIIDSLTLLPGLSPLPAGARVIDVGSGGGLPGVPIAVARPDLAVALLESTGKKARFLSECALALKLERVTVINTRAETAGQDRGHRQQYDAAVTRAIGPMNELLEYTLPLVKVGGFVLAMKGPKVEAELEAAGDAMAALGGGELAVFDAYTDEFAVSTVIVRIAKASATPRAYPRTPGTPRQTPL